MFLAFLRKVDILGATYNIKFDGSDSYKSAIGGFLSSIYFAIVTVYATIQITALVLRLNNNTAV
jgi:hypothetical protein